MQIWGMFLDALGVANDRRLRCTDAGDMLVTSATLSAGEDQTNDVVKVEERYGYETVAASQTQVLGATGAVNDYLHSIIITTSGGTITVLDGAISVAVIPAGAVGVWRFNIVSVSGAWTITTGGATSCTAVGRFS